MFRRNPSVIQSYFKYNLRRFKSSKILSDNKTSADLSEIVHFTKLANIWWDPEGPLKALYAMNNIRISLMKDGLKSTGIIDKEIYDSKLPFKNLNIMDIGCGGGLLSEELAKLGANVTGMDVTKDVIQLAKLHAKQNNLKNVKYFCKLIEDYANECSDLYDTIIASEVIEHVTEKQIFVENYVKCLKPGGSIFFTTFNRTFISKLVGIFLYENVFNVVPKGTHEWIKFISPNKLEEMLKKHKCKTMSVRGIQLNVFNTTYHWSPTTVLNYGLHAVKEKEYLKSEL